MAVQYVDSTGQDSAVRGMVAESGLHVRDASLQYQNPKDYLFDEIGQAEAYATNYNPSVTAGVNGETAAAAGLLAVTGFNVAATIANAETLFGLGGTGDFTMDDATVSPNRDGFKDFGGNYSLFPNITVA